MKFLTLADWTGMVETELFAQTYKIYGRRWLGAENFDFHSYAFRTYRLFKNCVGNFSLAKVSLDADALSSI